ncbi:MAG: 3-oxoacyl-[acyl-carrier-protein] synthase III C-terminal domain-containing protein [Planctomycetota bacterium]
MSIAATGAATPVSLAELRGGGWAPFAGCELDTAAACQAVFGEAWREALVARGWSVTHVEQVWGVRRRSWLAAPGAALAAGAPDVGALGVAAARQTLARAALRPEQLDALIVATSTPARATASLAGSVGRELGVRGACLDVRAGGAGGLMAWVTALGLLRQGARHALVVAAEAPSLWLDASAAALALLYGDGAGALLLQRQGVEGGASQASGSGGLLGGVLLNRPYGGRAMTVPDSLPPHPERRSARAFRMELPDADYLASLRAARHELLTSLRADHVAEVAAATAFLPGAVTLGHVAEDGASLGLPAELAHTMLATHGCLGTAAPLVALDSLAAQPSARREQTLVLSAVGGGISGAALLWRGILPAV